MAIRTINVGKCRKKEYNFIIDLVIEIIGTFGCLK